MSESNPYNFVIHKVYRLAYNAENPALRGKVVVFKGWQQIVGDIRRAIVRLVNHDGSLGEEWLVKPSMIIQL